MRIGEARKIAGSLGFPSKMPGTSYALPATACVAGSKLARVSGTVCSICYALGGGAKYQMPRAAKGMRRRLEAIARPQWVAAMVLLLTHEHSKPLIKVDLGMAGVRLQKAGGVRYRYNEPGFHRWHDSGDLQSVEHLRKICEVARLTPTIKHWLPTNELGFVSRYVESGGAIPDNLLIRVSSIKLDDQKRRAWSHTSSVFTATAPVDAYECPAPSQGHRCGSCRVCWSPQPHVAYRRH